MSDAKKEVRSIEGHYSYYGVPAYILRQKSGAYASGFYDPAEGVFKAGGSAKKILWDGVKISVLEAKRLIEKYSRHASLRREENGDAPDWILLPEEASFFLAQAEKNRVDGLELMKKLGPNGVPKKEKGPEKTEH